MKIDTLKKRVLIALAVLVLGFQPLFAGGGKSRGAGEFLLLHTNDHHGTVLPTSAGFAGLAERATLVREARAAHPHVLLLDAGDLNTGTPLSNMFNAEPDIIAYNMMGYDAMTIGNHEFDGDLEKLRAQMALADFPFLSANVKTTNGAYLGVPYIVKKYGSFSVGIFGLTTTRTTVIARPQPDVVFTNEIDAAREMVRVLRNREKVNVVIALTHMGDNKEADDHITSIELAEAVSGIDIIVDGHAHTFFPEASRIGATYLVSAEYWGLHMGAGRVTVRGGRMESFEWANIPVGYNAEKHSAVAADGRHTAFNWASVPAAADASVAAALATYVTQAGERLKEVIGQATALFDRSREQESSLGNAIADANVWYLRERLGMPVDFAFHNSGGIRTDLAAGPITREQVLTILPFENYVQVASLRGADIIELFNFMASIPSGAGAFPQVSSDVRFTIARQSGEVRNLTIGGAPVDPQKMYRFSTSDFVLNGGDGYAVLSRSEQVYNTSLLLSTVFMETIQARGAIAPVVEGRITVIP